MKVVFQKSFGKDLRKIKDGLLLARVKSAVESVEIAESLAQIRNIKKLKAEGEYYRIRVGDYRIGLELEEDSLIFVRCLHRKEIYRFFPD
jgi:mRNA interferase RelE/StbE